MTGKGCGNDGLWTVRKTRSRFSSLPTSPLEIAHNAIPTFRQPRLATAMEKWKSKDRTPTFPRLITFTQNQNSKGDQSRPATLVFRLISGLENALDQDRVKTIFGNRKRPCRRKLRDGRYGVVVETPAYDLTVFKVHHGELTLKIYTKRERVLRIEVVVHNAKELSRGRSLPNFPVTVETLRGMLERFLNSLHCMNRCFIADDLLERLPEPSQVGKAKVGGVDYNQLRTRVAMRASLALATARKGFTASDLARKAGDLNPSDRSYTPRQAAYDLRKLRGKQLVERIGSSHRFALPAKGFAP